MSDWWSTYMQNMVGNWAASHPDQVSHVSESQARNEAESAARREAMGNYQPPPPKPPRLPSSASANAGASMTNAPGGYASFWRTAWKGDNPFAW